MAHASAADRSDECAGSVIQAETGRPDSVSISDAGLLFTGDFRRHGPDLVLTGHDGRRHVVPSYFADEKHPALVAPNGASLSGELVDLLAGSPAPGEYAQAQPTAPADSIGKVEKVIGHVVVMRNGAAVALNVGDAVFRSDVIQTGGNSSVGIGFPDGTALNLVANTRMVLNEYSFDPNGGSNGALFSLVEGTFAFIAGNVAHTGHMKIETPVATLGIRGTTGFVQEVAAINSNLGKVTYSFAVADDYGTNRHGRYDLIDRSGNVIATISETGYLTFVTPQGPGLPPLVTSELMTNSQLGFEQRIIQQVFQTFILSTNSNGTPPSSPLIPGSGAPLIELNKLQDPIHEDTAAPLTTDIPTPSGTTGSATVTIAAGTSSPPGQISSTVTVNWVSPTSGAWDAGGNWNTFAPPAPQDAVDIGTPVKVTLDTPATIAGLTIGSAAILNIVGGGYLTVSNSINNSGTIQINSTGVDPTLAIDGAVFMQGGGRVLMAGPTAEISIIGVPGTGATLANADNTIIGTGTIGQGDGALTLTNGADGIIAAAGGTLVIDTRNPVSNSGTMVAVGGGTLQSDDVIDNFRLIGAGVGGNLLLTNAAIAGAAGSAIINLGMIEVAGSAVLANDMAINPAATLQIDPDATLTLMRTMIIGGAITNGGTIDVTGSSALVGNAVLTGGAVTVETTQTLLLDSATLAGTTVDNGGTVSVSSTLALAGTAINGGVVVDGGTIDVIGSSTIDGGASLDGGQVTVSSGNALVLDEVSVAGTNFTNQGTIKIDFSEAVTLNNATIDGGTINDGSGVLNATIEVSGNSTISGASLNNGGVTIDVLQTLTLNDDSITGTTFDAARGATLALSGVTVDDVTFTGDNGTLTIDNSGAFAFVTSASTIKSANLTNEGRFDSLQIDGVQVTLDDTMVSGGTIVEIGAKAQINIDARNSATLENTQLTLSNHSVVNGAVLVAGTLTIGADVTIAGSGTFTIAAGGTLSFGGSVPGAETVAFSGATGALILGEPSNFQGQIAGFAGTAADAASSDEIVLSNFDPASLGDTASYSSVTGLTTLTVHDQSNPSLTDTLYFIGDYTHNNTTSDFKFVQNGANLEIFDPPPTNSRSSAGAMTAGNAVSVSIGGPGNDHFVFAPRVGADTIGNAHPQQEASELFSSMNIRSMQQLSSIISTDAHGDAVIELGHDHSVAIPGVAAGYLEAHLQSLVHLH